MNGKAIPALALALALLAGCGGPPLPAGGEESSSGQDDAGRTVSGIITKVNGNEITLDLVTMSGQQAPREEDAGEAPVLAGEDETPQTPSGRENGERRQQKQEREEGSSGGGERPSGEGEPGGQAPQGEGVRQGSTGGGMPVQAPGGTGGSGGQRGYTRTGETAMYQIPVGAAVLTLTGTSRNFTSLSTDLLVTITFRADDVTPAQVQVIQSLS